MSKALEWAREQGESARQWITRLNRVVVTDLPFHEHVIYCLRHHQAVIADYDEPQQGNDEPNGTTKMDAATLRREKEAALHGGPTLMVAKEVYHCMSADERKLFEDWVRAECPQ